MSRTKNTVSKKSSSKQKPTPQAEIIKPKLDVLEVKTQQTDYNLLNAYEKKCLPATNYWRVRNGLPFIDVPKEDMYFWKYFDKRCFDIAESEKHRPPSTLGKSNIHGIISSDKSQ